MTPETTHRPWPLPQRPWVMAMRWHDLMFMHWPIRPEALRPLIPAMLELDTFDGWAWLGVVPFRMTGVRPRYLPAFLTSRRSLRSTCAPTSKHLAVVACGSSASMPRIGSRCARRASGMACHITTHACVWCKRAPRCIITVRGRIARRPPRPLRRAILPAVRSITPPWHTGALAHGALLSVCCRSSRPCWVWRYSSRSMATARCDSRGQDQHHDDAAAP